jgi:hypothetical protein
VTDQTPPEPGLKRAVKPDLWFSGPTVLYLDDIDEIYLLFQKVSPKVTLRLDGYELESPARTSQLAAVETRDFEIRIADPYTSLQARTRDFYFYAADDANLELRGLRDAVEELLNKRRLWTAKSMLPFLPLVVPIWLSLLIPKGPFTLPGLFLGVLTAGIYWTVSIISLRNFRRGGKVVLRDSHAKPSFRKQNRDLILVLVTIVGTLIATVIGGVILYLIVGRP